MPEEAGGNGAPRFPGCADGFEFLRRRTLAKALHFLYGGGESKIAGRPDIWAAEGGEEINVGSPTADALESDEHLARGVIMQLVKIAKVEMAASE